MVIVGKSSVRNLSGSDPALLALVEDAYVHPLEQTRHYGCALEEEARKVLNMLDRLNVECAEN